MPEGGFIRFDLMSDEQADILLEGAYTYERAYGELANDTSGESGYDPDRDQATYDFLRGIVYGSLRQLGATDPERLKNLVTTYVRSEQPHKQGAALYAVDSLFDYDEDFALETLAFFLAEPWLDSTANPHVDCDVLDDAYPHVRNLEDSGRLTEERARKLNVILTQHGAELYAFADPHRLG